MVFVNLLSIPWSSFIFPLFILHSFWIQCLKSTNIKKKKKKSFLLTFSLQYCYSIVAYFWKIANYHSLKKINKDAAGHFLWVPLFSISTGYSAAQTKLNAHPLLHTHTHTGNENRTQNRPYCMLLYVYTGF